MLDLGPTLIPYDLHLNQLHLQRPYIQIRPHSEVLVGNKFGGTLFNPGQRCTLILFLMLSVFLSPGELRGSADNYDMILTELALYEVIC